MNLITRSIPNAITSPWTIGGAFVLGTAVWTKSPALAVINAGAITAISAVAMAGNAMTSYFSGRSAVDVQALASSTATKTNIIKSIISRLNLFYPITPIQKLENMNNYEKTKNSIIELGINCISYIILSNYVQYYSEDYFDVQKYFLISIPIANHVVRLLTGNEFIPLCIFSIGHYLGFGAFIHELGHCIADKITDPNSTCKIHESSASVSSHTAFVYAGGAAAEITLSEGVYKV